jgi:hypothetical protein
MQPTSPTIDDIAAAYLAFLRTNDTDSEWASSAAIDLWLEARWEDLWQLVKTVALLPEAIDDQTLATFAAGPVEDLLAKAPAYADQVLELAASTPRLARMLTGVWRNAIEPEIWDKVVTFCRTVPDPIDGTYPH